MQPATPSGVWMALQPLSSMLLRQPTTAPVIGFYNFSFFNTNISNNNIGAITIQSTGTTTGFRGILVNTKRPYGHDQQQHDRAAITDTQVGSYAMYGIQCFIPILLPPEHHPQYGRRFERRGDNCIEPAFLLREVQVRIRFRRTRFIL